MVFSCFLCSLRHRAGQQSSIRDGISTALTTADLPANACRTPPDNDIARRAGLLQGFSCLAVSFGLWWRGFLPCAATTSPGGPGSYRGFPVWRCPAGCGGVGFCLARQRHRPGGPGSYRGFPGWRCLAGCGGMASCFASQGFRPPSRAFAPRSSAWRAALPVGARPPGRLVSPACAPCGFLSRRRPPGEPFSCKGFPSIPAPRTSSPHPRTFNVTPVTNFVTPRPGHGPSSPGCTTQGSVHNRYPIIPKGSLAHGARGAPYPRTHVTGCFSVRRAHHATTAKHLQPISLPAAYSLGGVRTINTSRAFDVRTLQRHQNGIDPSPGGVLFFACPKKRTRRVVCATPLRKGSPAAETTPVDELRNRRGKNSLRSNSLPLFPGSAPRRPAQRQRAVFVPGNPPCPEPPSRRGQPSTSRQGILRGI
jgi:hypothetical protein